MTALPAGGWVASSSVLTEISFCKAWQGRLIIELQTTVLMHRWQKGLHTTFFCCFWNS